MSSLVSYRGLPSLLESAFTTPFDLFEDFLYGYDSNDIDNSWKSSKSKYPKLNCYEDQGKFKVEASVPGMNTPDVKVEVLDGILTISGKSSSQSEKKDVRYLIKEMKQSSFSRSVMLPDNLTGEPTANVKDGVLTVSWDMKQKVESRAKTIPITS